MAGPVFQGPDAPDVELAEVSGFSYADIRRGTGVFQVTDEAHGWKNMTKYTKDGIECLVYSRTFDKSGKLEFLVRGEIPVPRDMYFSLNADMEYRPEWDNMCVAVTELKGLTEVEGERGRLRRLLHWEVKYPWPFGQRDYVLAQTAHMERDEVGAMTRCIQGCSVSEAEGEALKPSRVNVGRCTNYRSNMTIWEVAEQRCGYAFVFFEDISVSVPSWAISRTMSSTLPATMAAFPVIAKAYPRKRFQMILGRFGPGKGKLTEDDTEFYSASDDETTISERPERSGRRREQSTTERTPFTRSKSGASKRRSDGGHLRLSPTGTQKDPDQENDLEEGILVVSKQERDLLLQILEDMRQKQSSWWWCPCRRRCARSKGRQDL
uniref:START domain-containing protein n=1 Tax=Noctiluca scintillans TaxID=2966 RepID=A0A7S1ALX7_NOCSC|mmetsp:Transcript_51588/g.137694  ORF Transcript_51588/g.137694 Transcript_51588/m.137694 type:complete len:379 (+) Transcript_51588:46-1182(+)